MLNVLDARTHYSALCMRVCNLDASLDVYSLRSAIHVQAIIIAAMIICKYRDIQSTIKFELNMLA